MLLYQLISLWATMRNAGQRITIPVLSSTLDMSTTPLLCLTPNMMRYLSLVISTASIPTSSLLWRGKKTRSSPSQMFFQIAIVIMALSPRFSTRRPTLVFSLTILVLYLLVANQDQYALWLTEWSNYRMQGHFGSPVYMCQNLFKNEAQHNRDLCDSMRCK